MKKLKVSMSMSININHSSSVLRYSPVSAWLKITTAVGSNYFVWRVPRAATPNPRGRSLRL